MRLREREKPARGQREQERIDRRERERENDERERERERESVGRNLSYGENLDCNNSVSNKATTNHQGSYDVNSAVR